MRPYQHIAGSVFLAVIAVTIASAQSGQDGREIGRTTERELKVVLSSSFGSVSIAKGQPEKMLLVIPGRESDLNRSNVSYNIRNRVGYLDVALGEEARAESGHKKGVRVSGGLDRGRWQLLFSDAVPTSFDIELGVGKGVFDLTGLQVKDFNLTSGASDVYLTFDEPNSTTIENINIESGVSKFHGENLGNANFKRFKFQGGVGSYTLDFSGSLHNEVDVDVEVGMGSLTIIIPSDVGARVLYSESWISRLDYDRAFRKTDDDQYLTDNYATSEGRMNIRIDAGMGSVKVRRK